MEAVLKFWINQTCRSRSRPGRRDANPVTSYRWLFADKLGNVRNNNLEHFQDVAIL